MPGTARLFVRYRIAGLRPAGIVLGLLFCLSATAEVRLATTIMPPYQYMDEGRLSGETVEILNCAFQRLGHTWSSRILPRQRLQSAVEQGQADGFFLAMTAPRDGAGKLSAPLALEKWYWYTREKVTPPRDMPPDDAVVGALYGSNTLAWLRQRGRTPATVVGSLPQLVKLLETGRIDAFLADAPALQATLTELEPNPTLHDRFLRYTPLSVYFTGAFLRQQSRFLSAFNRTLNHCADQTYPLTDAERRRLRPLIAEPALDWIGAATVINRLEASNRTQGALDPGAIRALDARWREEFRSGEHELIADTLENPLSAFLRDRQQMAEGLFAEIFITNRHGLIAGMSRPTSDYLQADEAKFSKTFPPDSKGLFVEDIHYDESTRRFLTQVSRRIDHPDTGEPLGVVTLGVDVERALSSVPPGPHQD